MAKIVKLAVLVELEINKRIIESYYQQKFKSESNRSLQTLSLVTKIHFPKLLILIALLVTK